MATPTAEEARERAFDLFARAQEVGLTCAGTVAESLTALLRGVPGVGDGTSVPGAVSGLAGVPAEVVDRFYDTGIQILEAQRSVAHGVLEAVAPALRGLTVVPPPVSSRR